MIDYETYVQIRNHFIRDGLTYSQISNELGLDPRTIARWANQKRYQLRHSGPRKSKLDPFKNTIVQMLEKHHYSAQQVFQRIKDEGFTGESTIVQDYVRRVRPPKTKAYLKLAFAPGECAQVDWGSYGTVRVGSTTRRLSFFVMVLCHSRMMYVEFTVSQTMEHFLGCHQNALEFFGKVPEKIIMAIEDAFSFSAFSCEYIANILEQRSRPLNETGALHLTHKSDLLDITVQDPDIEIYNLKGESNA